MIGDVRLWLPDGRQLLRNAAPGVQGDGAVLVHWLRPPGVCTWRCR